MKTALYAIRSLDLKKDCLYNTNNRLIKNFFMQYPKVKNLSTLNVSKKSKTIKKSSQKGGLDPKYRQAQNKLIETIKSNFEQIKEYKEQKTQLSNAVFKLAEFMMSDNLKKGGNLD